MNTDPETLGNSESRLRFWSGLTWCPILLYSCFVNFRDEGYLDLGGGDTSNDWAWWGWAIFAAVVVGLALEMVRSVFIVLLRLTGHSSDSAEQQAEEAGDGIASVLGVVIVIATVILFVIPAITSFFKADHTARFELMVLLLLGGIFLYVANSSSNRR